MKNKFSNNEKREEIMRIYSSINSETYFYKNKNKSITEMEWEELQEYIGDIMILPKVLFKDITHEALLDLPNLKIIDFEYYSLDYPKETILKLLDKGIRIEFWEAPKDDELRLIYEKQRLEKLKQNFKIIKKQYKHSKFLLDECYNSINKLELKIKERNMSSKKLYEYSQSLLFSHEGDLKNSKIIANIVENNYRVYLYFNKEYELVFKEFFRKMNDWKLYENIIELDNEKLTILTSTSLAYDDSYKSIMQLLIAHLNGDFYEKKNNTKKVK